MKVHNTKKWSWIGVVCVLLASLVLLWPLFRQGFFITDDGDWMIIRFSSFYQSIAEGQFPVRFLGRLNHNYGYPVVNFLYPGFLYAGSFIRVLGFSYVDTIKIIISLSIAGSGLLLYFTLKKYHETLESVAGTVSFVLSPYVVFDLYKRGSVGELFAFLSASLLLFGIVGRYIWIIPLATAALLISHNSLALIFLVVISTYLCCFPKILEYGKALLIGIGMATFFWLPALYERRYIIFDSVSVSDPFSYFITQDNAFLLGFGVIAALFILFNHSRKIVVFDKIIAFTILVSAFFSLPMSAFIWKSIPLASQLVQFPFRFLSVVSLMGAFSIASGISLLSKKNKVIVIFLFVCLLIYSTVYKQQFITYVNHGEGYYSTNEGTTTVRNEYMPKWVKEMNIHRPRTKVEVISGDAEYSSYEETPQRIIGILDVKQQSQIQINTIYYPGWGVTLDGILRPVEYNNPYGLMRFVVEKGKYTLEASFRETGFRLIADIISLAFGMVYIVWMIKNKS